MSETPPSQASATIVDWQTAREEERKVLSLGPDEQPTALCLSGGGVRSAALCLGVLRSLADRDWRLLRHFHYLSTVSGGGYIGAWLTRFIADQDAAQKSRSIEDIEAIIGARPSEGEAPPVKRLRGYANFLVPQSGLLSLDTLAGVLLWLRNTLINWFIFLPIFGALAAAPLLHFAGMGALLEEPLPWFGEAAIIVLSCLCLLAGVFASIVNLPTHAFPDGLAPGKPAEAFGKTGRRLIPITVVPLLAWCVLVPAAVAPHTISSTQSRHIGTVFWAEQKVPCPVRPAPACPAPAMEAQCAAPAAASCCTAQKPAVAQARAASCARPKRQDYPSAWYWQILLLPILSFAVCLLAYGLAWRTLAQRTFDPPRARYAHLGLFRAGICPWLASAAVSSLLLWWGICLARDAGLYWVTLAGPLWVALAETLRITIYVALRHKSLRGDLDREWLARLNGIKLVVALAGAAGGAVVVVGGAMLDSLGADAVKATTGGGLVSGGLVAWIGRSARTAFSARDAATKLTDGALAILTNLGIVVFAAALFLLIGQGLAQGIGWITEAAAGRSPWVLFAVCLLTLAALLILAFGLGRLINLNRFSMHAVYRNRLIRAFLGSARKPADRRPDPFTRFDPLDNIRIADAFTDRSPARLFPVINTALNRTSGIDTARAERKADSFTITPLRCGSAALGQPAEPNGKPRGAYALSRAYAGNERETGWKDERKGISLGTAMAISGAAASPNMGYHSSPLTAFVMTLLNVRLGAWLPNPGADFAEKAPPSKGWKDRGKALLSELLGTSRMTAKQLRRSGPRNAVRASLSDLTGRSDDRQDYIYLSDGGHFDNLGLYEMLRRECGLMLVIDAGQDQEYAYADLARALNYARIDFGTEVTFLKAIRVGEKKLSAQGAFAIVRYRSGRMGRIAYLKSWLPEDAPVELLAMRARKKSFPHESTLNQFFTESDFEAYRRLGEYLMDAVVNARVEDEDPKAVDPIQGATSLHSLFERLERIARRKVSTSEAVPARDEGADGS